MSTLTPDAYAFILLQREYRYQMDCHAAKRRQEQELRDKLDRVRADALTAEERATSIMETLLKLEPPRDAPPLPVSDGEG